MPERIKAVLSILSVLVFAFLVFIAIFASLIALVTIQDYRGGEFAVVAGIWSVTALLIFAGVKFIIRPRTRGWGGRALATALLAISMLFVHPWLFGTPGIIGESILVGNLRTGMSRDQVHVLARRTGGYSNYDPGNSDNPITIQYTRWATVCVARGDTVQIKMGVGGATAWHTVEWSEGC